MSFYDWLLKFKDVDLPIGDLAKDVAQDNSFPKKSKTWSEIENHISTGSNWRIIEVAQNAFNYYSADELED